MRDEPLHTPGERYLDLAIRDWLRVSQKPVAIFKAANPEKFYDVSHESIKFSIALSAARAIGVL